ncbi:hypothetical protein U0070_023632, partial [Myodes glareolus]
HAQLRPARAFLRAPTHARDANFSAAAGAQGAVRVEGRGLRNGAGPVERGGACRVGKSDATRAGCTGDFLVKQQQQKHQPSKQPRRAKKGERKSPSLTPPRATRAPRLCADAAERSRRFDAPPKSMAAVCCTMHALCACTSDCVPGSENCGGSVYKF